MPKNQNKTLETQDYPSVGNDAPDKIQLYIDENIENVSEFIDEMQKMDVDILEVFARYKGLKDSLGQLNENIDFITELVNRMAAAFFKVNRKTGDSFKQFVEKITKREQLIVELEKNLKDELVSMINNGVFKFNIDNFIFYLKTVNNNLGLIKDYLANAHQSIEQ